MNSLPPIAVGVPAAILVATNEPKVDASLKLKSLKVPKSSALGDERGDGAVAPEKSPVMGATTDNVEFNVYDDVADAVDRSNVDDVVPPMPKDPLANAVACAAPTERAIAATAPNSAFEDILINSSSD
jgi:hypothetical protein